jgi:hypothetical protein
MEENIRKNLTYAPNDDKKEAQIEHHIKDGVQFEDLPTGPLVKGGVHSHLQYRDISIITRWCPV